MARIDVSGLGGFIRDQRDQAQMSLRQLAKAADVSNPYLSQVERGLRRPSAEILNRIAQGLRISAETLYVQAGILDEREGDEAVTARLHALAAGITELGLRRAAFQLAVYCASSDGEFSADETDFLEWLASAFGFAPEDAEAMIHGVIP